MLGPASCSEVRKVVLSAWVTRTDTERVVDASFVERQTPTQDVSDVKGEEMARVLIWYDKDGDTVWPASSDRSLELTALAILKDRLRYGYIVGPDATEARVITNTEDGRRALQILKDRSAKGFEYERIAILDVKVR